MSRKEFLKILRECLEGELPMEEVKANLKYYSNYIDESTRPESVVIEELGDPRLIARTIITSYQAGKGPMAGYYQEQARTEYSNNQRRGEFTNDEGDFTFMFNGRELKWYEKLIAVLLVIVLFLVVLAVLKIAVSVVLWLIPVVVAAAIVIFIVNKLFGGGQ